MRAIRRADPGAHVAVVSSEDEPAYSRVMLPHLVSGEVGEQDVLLGDDGNSGRDTGARLFRGRSAVEVNRTRCAVLLDDGSELRYDHLLIATGSVPVRPPLPGIDMPGCFHMWTLQDARRILAEVGKATRAVVIGGGLVGLQAAGALAGRGVRVTVVERLDRLLPNQLDPAEASMLEARARERGVEVMVASRVSEIAGAHRVEGVLAGGTLLRADLVVVAAGVRPNTELARRAGLALGEPGSSPRNTGILADRYGRAGTLDGFRVELPPSGRRGVCGRVEGTSEGEEGRCFRAKGRYVPLRNVYVAGDVAETFDPLLCASTVNAVWPEAVRQGAVAGRNMVGGEPPPAVYEGSVAQNAATLFGLCFASAGLSTSELPGLSVTRSQSRPGFSRRLVFRDDRLVGFVLVGDIRAAGLLRHLMRLDQPLSRVVQRQALLEADLSYPALLRILEKKAASLLPATLWHPA